MKWYLSGPMSGYPDFNYPLFRKARKVLTDHGFDISDPVSLDEEQGVEVEPNSLGIPDHSQYCEWLGRDVTEIMLNCEGIILLPGWHESKGARLEATVGLLFGMKFKEVADYQDAGMALNEITPTEVAERVHGTILTEISDR